MSWHQLITTFPSFETHLERTSSMLYGSILRGDNAAAREMTGVLQHWLGHHRLRLESARYSVQKPLFVSIIDLNNKDWDELSKTFHVQPLVHDQNSALTGLYGVGLSNYWVDINCIIIYLLILVGKNSSEVNNNLALRTAKALINGEVTSPDIDVVKPVKSFQNLIESLIRQLFASDGQYNRHLDELVERLQSLSEREMRPGRIRMRLGSQGLDSVNDGQIIFLICLASSAWKPETDSRFVNQLLQLSAENDHTARELQSFLDSLIKRTSEIDCGEWNYIFSFIRGIEPDETVFEKSKKTVTSTMQNIKEIIDNARNKRLIEAEISNARLAKIAQAASSLAFSKETASLPISFFSEVEKSSLMAEERSLSINDYEKGCLTDPIMAALAVGEDERFAITLKDHVASFVMADVLKQCEILTVDASTADKYWTHLKQAANTILENGCHPILLLENSTIPRWVWDWQWPQVEGRYQRPPDLIVSREQDMNEAYIAHFNKIAVYRGPVPSGASYILPRELFKKLTFTKFENGYEIRPSPESTKNPIFVNLVLHWAQKVELNSSQVTQLRYDSAGLEDED